MPALPSNDTPPGILDQQIIRSGRLHQELSKLRHRLCPRPSTRPSPSVHFHIELSCTCTRPRCETCTPRLELRVTIEYPAAPGQVGYREGQAFIQLSDQWEDWNQPAMSPLVELRNHLFRQRFLLGPCVRLWRGPHEFPDSAA